MFSLPLQFEAALIALFADQQDMDWLFYQRGVDQAFGTFTRRHPEVLPSAQVGIRQKLACGRDSQDSRLKGQVGIDEVLYSLLAKEVILVRLETFEHPSDSGDTQQGQPRSAQGGPF